MSRYRLTELAQEDLFDIRYRVTADHDEQVAGRILKELRQQLDLLSEFPSMGRQRPDLTDEVVRFFPFYSWLVVFRPDTKPLEVVRVVSAYRAPENYFESP